MPSRSYPRRTPALCSPRGLSCAGTYSVISRFGAMTSTAPGVLAGARWHSPTPIRRPTERCRGSLPAGGAASAIIGARALTTISPGSAGRNFFESVEALIIQKAAQLAAAAGVLELAQRLGLYLADALARHRELLADLFQRVVGIHADAEAHAQHALFAWRQGRQHAGRSLAQIGLNRGVDRQDRVLVLDEIAEMGILLVADRGFQRQRLLGDLEHLAHLLERHAELLGKLLGRGLAADLVEHLARGAHDLVDGLDHVHGDADGARLVGDRARDRLPDPPRGIGRELVAATILEFVDRLHQADVALLDQVEELQAAVGVFLGDGDDEAQVRLHHLLLGLARLALALLHHVHDLAELADLESGLAREHLDLVAVLLDLLLVPRDEALPAPGRKLRHAIEPARIEFGALVVPEKILARDAVALREPHQAALVADQALVDVIELLYQRIDARLIEPQRLHLADD